MIRKDHKWISEIDGKPITAHAHYFSPDEQSKFREILGKHEGPKVEAFIRSIEPFMDYTLRILHRLSAETHVDHKDKLFAKRRHFEAAYKDILEICSGRFQVLPARQCDHSNWDCQDVGNPRVKIRRDIAFAASFLPKYLQEIIEGLKLALEIDKVKRGNRHKADSFFLGFQIAKSFEKYIGVPRPYSGPFPAIVNYCFDIIEKKDRDEHHYKAPDRTRAVRQALRKLASYRSPKLI